MDKPSISTAAAFLGRRSAEARRNQLGEEEFLRQMRHCASLGGRARKLQRRSRNNMYLTIKRMPASRAVGEYRLLFSDQPGTRPTEFPRIRGAEALHEFLIEKLELSPTAASAVLTEVESTNAGLVRNVQFTADDLRILLRRLEQEQQRQAAAEHSRTVLASE